MKGERGSCDSDDDDDGDGGGGGGDCSGEYAKERAVWWAESGRERKREKENLGEPPSRNLHIRLKQYPEELWSNAVSR